MAKKSVKKTSRKKSPKSKKKTSKKTSPVKKKVAKNVYGVGVVSPESKFYKDKFNLVVKNLITFIILWAISLLLYTVAGNQIYINLFGLLSIIFGFVSVALFIVLLIFLFLKVFRK
ncbi:hypothetical protein K9L16_00130 [Candidatus Pacearchaeota archaeon]|nr:hypothetical protein [Candidatus Pacearchaeota archaeon]